MTVIAWDGKTLAADKQSTNEGHARTVTKIHQVPGGILGLTGDAPAAMALLDWCAGGRDADKWPKAMPNLVCHAIFIDRERKIHLYSSDAGPYPEILEDKFYAAGHGRDFALAAMYLGKDAADAVKVACALDKFCGMGVDTLAP
jgi:hypothetical protein